jgi:hypothetical protein
MGCVPDAVFALFGPAPHHFNVSVVEVAGSTARRSRQHRARIGKVPVLVELPAGAAQWPLDELRRAVEPEAAVPGPWVLAPEDDRPPRARARVGPIELTEPGWR